MLRTVLLLLVPLPLLAGPREAAGLVGGEAAIPENHPWVVYVTAVMDESRYLVRRQVCTGVLIAPSLVLSAAHCVERNEWEVPAQFSFSIKMVAGRQQRSVARVVAAPRSTSRTIAMHDMALLVPDTPFILDLGVSTIPVAEEHFPEEGVSCTVAGFGSEENPGLGIRVAAVRLQRPMGRLEGKGRNHTVPPLHIRSSTRSSRDPPAPPSAPSILPREGPAVPAVPAVWQRQDRAEETPILTRDFVMAYPCSSLGYSFEVEGEEELFICLERGKAGLCHGDSGGALVCDGAVHGIAQFIARVTSPLDHLFHYQMPENTLCGARNTLSVYRATFPSKRWISENAERLRAVML